MRKKLIDVAEGNIFNYDGSTYCKYSGSVGNRMCFKVEGFIENNKSEYIKSDTIVIDTGKKFSEYIREAK